MRRASGYTLLELMIVVVLIGISVAVAVPVITNYMAESKQHQAAIEVTLVYNRAHDLARKRGATVLVVADTGGDPSGTFWVFEAPRVSGVVNPCGSVNWAAIPLPAAPALSFANEEWTNHGMFARRVGGGTVASVCYAPLGACYVSPAGATGPFEDTLAGVGAGANRGGLRYEILREDNVRARNVVVPTGSCIARIRQ